jgi:LAO/AO transport system kinase
MAPVTSKRTAASHQQGRSDAGTQAYLEDLIAGVVAGNARSIGRLISIIESGGDMLRALAPLLAPFTGRAQVVGITGPPGAGKSTLTAALVGAYRQRGHRVGVLAVDPSSPFTGGALLGDRIRMQDYALDPLVFIRSLATRGHLGGLATAVPQATRVLDAAGHDVVLVETVGVGQSEVDIALHADTTLVLTAPGAGDGVQAAKAGVLEIADVYVVNKADCAGADAVVRDLRQMQALGGRTEQPSPWPVPILRAVAQGGPDGEGIADLMVTIERHRVVLKESGALTTRRVARARAEVEGIAIARIRGAGGPFALRHLEELSADVAGGRIDAYGAADHVLRGALTRDESQLERG